MKKRIDSGQWAFLCVTVLCLTYIVAHVDLERVEGWLALLPGILIAAGQVYSMSRGRAVAPKEEP